MNCAQYSKLSLLWQLSGKKAKNHSEVRYFKYFLAHQQAALWAGVVDESHSIPATGIDKAFNLQHLKYLLRIGWVLERCFGLGRLKRHIFLKTFAHVEAQQFLRLFGGIVRTDRCRCGC